MNTRRPRTIVLLASAALLLCAPSLIAQTSSFTTFAAPDAVNGTYPGYINSNGLIAGGYEDANFSIRGFIRDQSGAITEFDPPVAVPHIRGFNRRGQIIGSGLVGSGEEGFLRTISGQFFHIHVTGSKSTESIAINDVGQIAGFYVGGSTTGHAFLRASNGTYTFFDDPAAAPGGTVPSSINNNGQIAGYFIDQATGATRVFLRDQAGNFTNFDPAAGGVSSIDSISINLSGEIAGRYFDSNEVARGFLRDASGNIVDFEVPGSDHVTSPTSINDAGVIVGYWYDSSDVTHGFLRDASGNFTIFSVVPGYDTNPTSINNTGRITGFYRDSSLAYRGFVR